MKKPFRKPRNGYSSMGTRATSEDAIFQSEGGDYGKCIPQGVQVLRPRRSRRRRRRRRREQSYRSTGLPPDRCAVTITIAMLMGANS